MNERYNESVHVYSCVYSSMYIRENEFKRKGEEIERGDFREAPCALFVVTIEDN